MSSYLANDQFYPSVPYSYINPYTYPSATPSAPPLEEIDVPGYSPYTPAVQPWNNVHEQANEAYLHIWNDLQVVQTLPSLNLDDTSIQTLKQIEEKSNQGIVRGLLTLMIKVLQVVGKLALGFTVAISVSLVISALLGLPVAAVILSLIVASPVIGSLVIGGLVCKIAAHILQHIREKGSEHSFRSAIQGQGYTQQMQDLKTWTKMEKLSEMERRIQDTLEKFQVIQKNMGYNVIQNQQELYLKSLLKKIEHFYEVENKLDREISMPLLNRFLAN